MREATKREANKAWDRIRSLAHEVDRRKPGAGEEFLLSVARRLDQIHAEQLSALSGFPAGRKA